MKKKPGGHPAKQDPSIGKLFKAMTMTKDLVKELDGRLTDEQMLYLKAINVGMMFTYAELTGLPNPAEIIHGPVK